MNISEQEFGQLQARTQAIEAMLIDLRSELRQWRSDMSNRLHALERWRAWLTGGLAALGALWVALWGWIIGR